MEREEERTSSKRIDGEEAAGTASPERTGSWLSASRIQLTSVAVLTAIGTAMRLVYLYQPPRYDEITTFFAYATGSLPLALAKNNPPCNPIFHSLLVNISARLFGDVDWAIRFPAFIAGILIIPLTFLVFRKIYNGWAGLLAAALVTPSSILIIYSTNARSYTVQAALYLGLVLLAIRLKRRRCGAWEWAGFTVLGVLSLFTIPTSLYFLGGVILWLGISALWNDTFEHKKSFLVKLVISSAAAGAITVLLYIPMVVRSGLKSVIANPMVESIPFRYFALGSLKLMADTWKSWTLEIPLVIVIILAIGFMISVIYHKKLSRDRIDIALVTIGWIVLLVLAQRSVATERHWIPLLPIFLGCAAAGLQYAGKKALTHARRRGLKYSLSPLLTGVLIIALCLLLCAPVLGSRTPYQKGSTGTPSRDMSFKDARTVASMLKQMLRPEDIVFVDHLAVPTLEYYFLEDGIPLGHLYGNVHGAENPASPDRAIVIEAFADQHYIPDATKGLVSDAELARSRVYSLKDSRILVVEGYR
jgi:hypothetical protein